MAFQNEFLRNDVAGRRLEHGANAEWPVTGTMAWTRQTNKPGGNPQYAWTAPVGMNEARKKISYIKLHEPPKKKAAKSEHGSNAG
jgi:hypothetical protein